MIKGIAHQIKVGEKEKGLNLLSDTLDRVFNGTKTAYIYISTKEQEEVRSLRQNSLSFKIYEILSKQDAQGDINYYRAYCKLHFGVPVMLTNEKFAKAYNERVKHRFDYEQKLNLMLEPVDFPVTSLMGKKQFSDYVGMIERAFPSVRFDL